MALAGQVIVVTGASAGIGKALSIELKKRGANVVLVARTQEKLDALVKELGEGALAVRADVTKRADVDAALGAAVARFGHVDVWVNNAGRGITRMPDELTDEDVDTIIQDNLKSALYGMQAALRHFRTNGNKGQLVNVSSMLSRVPFVPFRSIYSAAKAALNSLTESFRVQLLETSPNITVTLVLPGIVATEFGLNALGGGNDSRRAPGAQTAEEVATVIADAIEHKKREVYTHPTGPERVASYRATLT